MNRRVFTPAGLLLGLGCATGCSLDQTSTATGALAGTVFTGPLFNNPNGTAAQQDAIRDYLVDLVAGAPAGSTIRLSSFTFGDDTLANTLITAKARGVTVQVVLDHTSLTNDYGKLTYPILAGLGKYTGDDTTSWVLVCPADHACLAEKPSPSANSVNHNKFYLFSRTSGA